MPNSPQALFLLVVLVIGLVSVAASGQDDEVARLRARVAQAPTDASLRCQLSFALVGVGAHEEARQQAEGGVTAISRPLTERTRRTLSACLYNRGRAEEALGQRREAVTDYVASLLLRDHRAVRTRLDALVPNVPSSLPAAALVALEEGAPELTAGETPITVRAGSMTWHFVTARTFGDAGVGLWVFALTTREEGRVLVRAIDGWTDEDFGALMSIGPTRTIAPLAASGGVSVIIEATGQGNCGGMNGVMDFEHRATAFVALSAERIVSHAIITQQDDCDGHVSAGLRLHGSSIEITHARGGALEPGTYTIESLLR